MTFFPNHARWQAVRARDPSAHSSFIYAVTTTSIYCRPTCPARLARRANIVFFDTPDEAVAAGFRACKRCKPESAAATLQDRQREAVKQACEILQQSRGVSKLQDVAKRVGLSPRYFHGVFKQAMGMTPAQYAKDRCGTQKDCVNSRATQLSTSALGTTTITNNVDPLCGVGTDVLAFADMECGLSEPVPRNPDTAIDAILGLLQTNDLATTTDAEMDFAVSQVPFHDAAEFSLLGEFDLPLFNTEAHLYPHLEYS